MMIMQPDWITEAMFAEAGTIIKKKKDPATLPKLHHEFMPAHQYTFNGKHHEIYLSDPRRVAPEKLKTVLRQPIIRKP